MDDLVENNSEVFANVRQFNSDLKARTNIRTQLSQFRHWYYVPEYGFGPAKFIGHKNINTSKCARGKNKHGYRAEVRLRRWFRPLSQNSSQHKGLRAQLEELLTKYGKTPRSNAVIHVPQ